MIWADEGKRENKNKQIYCCFSQWFKDPLQLPKPRYVVQKKSATKLKVNREFTIKPCMQNIIENWKQRSIDCD